MDDELPPIEMDLDEVAAAGLGAWLDTMAQDMPRVEWFGYLRPDGGESPRLYVNHLRAILSWRDEMKKVNAEAMAVLSALETGLVGKVTALEVFRDDDGTGWIKAADLHAALVMVADGVQEDRA